MKKYKLYSLINNRDLIEREMDSKSKKYFYKAINSYPQFYLVLYSNKNSITCSPVYFRNVKRTIKTETTEGNFCWVSYALFISLPSECLEEVDVEIKDAELFCRRLYNKHKTHVENTKKEKAAQHELKKASKKAAKKDKKNRIKGAPKNFVSNPNHVKKRENSTGGSIPWRLISSAGRGDKI